VSELTERVDAIFQAYDRSDSPGCALGVLRDGELVYARGYGTADLEHDVPISAESIFHVASVSKQFTACAVALLAEDGKLSLDDDVRKFLPELPDYGDTITLRHLINHTSGLRDQWDLLAMAGWREHDVKTNGDVLALAIRQRALNFRPGDESLYCNTGYTLLGLVVERVTGQSLRAFTEERLFRPLGMSRTHFHDDHTMIVKDRAYAYVPRDEGGFRVSIPAFDTVGATSLFTTVGDLARWVHGFWESRRISAALVEQMLTPGRLNDGEMLPYAFGVIVGAYRGVRIVEHSGGDAGYRSHLIWFPEQHFAVAVLGNLSKLSPSALARQVADVYLMDHLTPVVSPRETVAVSPSDLARWTGLYEDQKTGGFRHLEVLNGRLTNVLGWRFELELLGPDHFRVVQAPTEVAFVTDPAGATELRVSAEGRHVATYRAVPAATPSRADLAAYVGRYQSDEVEAEYLIDLQGGNLVWRRLRSDDTPLVPTVTDGFSTESGTRFRFQRDARGAVDRITVSTDRVRGVVFRKQPGD
jgi:CubicO group peptidase (beta-lactamase class C family)